MVKAGVLFCFLEKRNCQIVKGKEGRSGPAICVRFGERWSGDSTVQQFDLYWVCYVLCTAVVKKTDRDSEEFLVESRVKKRIGGQDAGSKELGERQSTSAAASKSRSGAASRVTISHRKI